MGISLSGLASGLNTNAMIEQLMKLERQPLNKMEAQREVVGYQKDIMRDLNTKLNALKTAASELTLSAGFNLSGGASSNKDAIGITVSDNAAKGVYNVEVTSIATNHSLKSKEIDVGAMSTIIANKDEEVVINGKTFKIRGDNNKDILQNLANDINASADTDADAKVNAAVIETKPGFMAITFTAKDSGTTNKINWSGSAATKLGMTDAVEVKDAVFKVNGVEVTRSTNEIKDVIAGATLTLNAKDTSSTITIKQDSEKIASKIEAFVNAYNDVAGTIRDSIKKDGAMQGDSLLKSIDSTLFNLFSSNVNTKNSAFSMMSQIGMEIDKGITDPKLMTGKITLDKEKLLAKLKEDPQAVANLFSIDEPGSPEVPGEAGNPGKPAVSPVSGIAVQLDKMINSWTNSVDGLLTSSIKGYDSQLSMIDERMEVLDNRLLKKEKSLQAQFAAMEVALSKLKNEQNWLNGQLNQLTANAQANK